jgi:hypothetical protein
MGSYRTALTKGFLFKFLVASFLGLSSEGPRHQFDWLGDAEQSAVKQEGCLPLNSVQFYADAMPDAIVGQPLKHRAADLQACHALTWSGACIGPLIAWLQQHAFGNPQIMKYLISQLALLFFHSHLHQPALFPAM